MTDQPHHLDVVHESPQEIAQDRKGLVRLLNPFGRLWLRAVARVLEYASDLVPTHLNLSWITDQLAVGGAPKKRDYRRLAAAGITGVIDCREETSDDEAALERVGIKLLRLPIKDRYAHSDDQLRHGVRWAVRQIEAGGRVLVHCQHGVGRAPLVGASILISQGLSAPEAIKTIRMRRWQAAPNDRQIEAILGFEERWKLGGRDAEQPIPPSRQAAPAQPRTGPIQEAAHAGPSGAAQPSADGPTSGQTGVDALQARLDALQHRLEARSERSS